jgi:hypothetical protein
MSNAEEPTSERPYLYKTTCRLYLLSDRVDSSFYRWFEELGNFGSRPVALVKAFQVARAGYSPCQLQLTLTDTDTEVLIKRRTELDILRILLFAKQTLGRFIKALGNMF